MNQALWTGLLYDAHFFIAYLLKHHNLRIKEAEKRVMFFNFQALLKSKYISTHLNHGIGSKGYV